MRKTIAILITALLALVVLTTCDNDSARGTCTVTFEKNGATDGTMDIQRIARGTTANLTRNSYSRTGYFFMGWNTSADGSGTSYSDRAEITASEDLILYAQWAVRGVSITFDSNNGSGETSSQVVPLNTPAALRANTFQNADYGFACWNTRADGSGASFYDCAQIEAPHNMTLYAQWGVILTDDDTSWNESTYILNSDVTMNYIVLLSTYDVRLILRDGCTLTASKGILIPDGACLTIDAEGTGTGRIEAAGDGNAAIGGAGSEVGGAVIINGGIINASSTDDAGIGGGLGGTAGPVTINGGTVTASSTNGAGIGGGYSGTAGPVTINGGTVTASSNYGAGIGGGNDSNGSEVTVTGTNTKVFASSYYGDGIGKGIYGTSDGTLDSSISLLVSDDGTNWSDYDGLTRKKYMKTVNYD